MIYTYTYIHINQERLAMIDKSGTLLEVEPNHGVYVEQNYEEMFKQYVDIKKLKEKEQESCWSCLIDELIKQGFIIIRKNCVIVVLNKINNKQAKTLDSFLSEVGVLKVKEYTEEENTEYEYRPSGNTMGFTKEISLDDFYSLYNQHANHGPHN